MNGKGKIKRWFKNKGIKPSQWMAELLKWEKLKWLRAWGLYNPSYKKRTRAIPWLLVVFGIVLFLVVINLVVINPEDDEKDWGKTILYVDLGQKETAEIRDRLEALEIRHELTSDFSSIFVPESQVRFLRLRLAREGLPKKGRIGYEFFEQHSYRGDLERELAKTLMGIEEVRSVRVQIIMPDSSLFIHKPEPLKASVTLFLTEGVHLKKEGIEAIAHLVSASVKGLEKENVVIVDPAGNLLSEETNTLTKITHEPFRQQQQVALVLEKRVQALLDGVIGEGNSIVHINVILGSETEKNGDTLIREPSDQPDIDWTGRIKRLSMALTIEKIKVVLDGLDEDTAEYIETTRSSEEIQNLVSLAKEAAGFDESRGDQISVISLRFDKTSEILARNRGQAEERKEFWTDIAINVAKILGIVAALVTCRFIVEEIDKEMGVEDILSYVAGIESQEEKALEAYLERESLFDEYSQELQTAHDMQMDLMPKEAPQIEGFGIAGRCIPANHVGGDLFQYFQIEENRWVVCLADVTGHGMSAAIPVVMFSGVLKSQISVDHNIEKLLEQLNRSMYSAMASNSLTERTFVCFMGVDLDTSSGTLRMSNSGCPPPYYFNASTSEVMELQVDAYPLGVRQNSSYKAVEVQLKPGDRVISCSDGLIEAENKRGELFGFDRMIYLIRRACKENLSAEVLLERVMVEVYTFTEGAPPGDDRTCVVLSVEG